MNVGATLHHPRREQRLAFLLCLHVLLVAARAQRQEAERPHDGDDRQGQKNVLPAVICEGKITALRRFCSSSVVMATVTRRPGSTWYLRPSVPLEIDVKISKQHAGKEIKGVIQQRKGWI